MTLSPCDYDLASLSTWVQRPQAITRCGISDVYAMRALVRADVDKTAAYISRDVYLLDRWPCRMVEIVAWVAGVDHKEKRMILTLDDGDGRCVLPVDVDLAPVPQHPGHVHTDNDPGAPDPVHSKDTFLSAKERKAIRKEAERKARLPAVQQPTQSLARPDIRVGDTVRVVGQVNEWSRKKQTGLEWVRDVKAGEGYGGSIVVVDEEEQYDHVATVVQLRKTLYSQPFTIPPPSSVHASDAAHQASARSTRSRPSSPSRDSFSDLASSEIGSTGIDLIDDVQLRDPSKLRTSSLTDATFRKYALDHMTRETLRFVVSSDDPASIFPEYLDMVTPTTSTTRSTRSTSHRLGPHARIAFSSFTSSGLIDVPQLNELARLVVDNAARKDEKRRRRRIQNGTPRPGDLETDLKRQQTGRDWRLTDETRLDRMKRLVAWCIRDLHRDGCLVGLDEGYVPLPPELLFPVLVPHLERETLLRKSVFLRKGDSRRDNGVSAVQVLNRLRPWGKAGRWDRIQEWLVQETLEWAEGQGSVRRMGDGWVYVERV